MAKGLRSKSARRFRAIKRETVYGPVEDARVQRLSERLKKDAQGPKTSELEAIARGEEPMQVEKSKSYILRIRCDMDVNCIEGLFPLC
jgi:hypothetical protein